MNGKNPIDGAGLRERNIPQRANSIEQAQEVTVELNAKEFHSEKHENDKKTFGRTPDGTSEYSTLNRGVQETYWHGSDCLP